MYLLSMIQNSTNNDENKLKILPRVKAENQSNHMYNYMTYTKYTLNVD